MTSFQIQFLIVLILSFSLIGSNIIITNSSAQEDTQIPSWVKNVAGWWAADEISEREFLTGIEYMINKNIISLPTIPCSKQPESQTSSPANLVPNWIKNNANWWATDQISDIDFINGIEFLIKKQIMMIDNENILGKVPLDDVIFSPSWNIDKNELVYVASSFFEVYAIPGDCIVKETGTAVWRDVMLGLNPNKMDTYNEFAVWDEPQNIAVVFPFFTSTAYTEPGFYTYFRGECDDCTTTQFSNPVSKYTASGKGHQALSLLGYESITDMDIDLNPDVLLKFDKVIMLHSEYVTRVMFDAITSHPNVVFLYPNALYAEIEVDYPANTITLIRGHNYPEPSITNGFDWEYDNTHPYEYDNKCLNMEIYRIKNGWMTNCYPENVFLQNSELLFGLLKTIKDL